MRAGNRPLGPARPSQAALWLLVCHRPRPHGPPRPGGAVGLWGGTGRGHVVDHQVGDWRAAQPPLGSFFNPSNRPWRLRTAVTPGGGPQVPHAPRGVLGVLWGASMAALALKPPSGRFLPRLIAKATLNAGCDCCQRRGPFSLAERRREFVELSQNLPTSTPCPKARVQTAIPGCRARDGRLRTSTSGQLSPLFKMRAAVLEVVSMWHQ